MISIIQKRKSILALPFTSDKKGVQMCCTIAIVALISPNIAAVSQMAAKTNIYQETLLPDNKNWLECDIVHESLLYAEITRQPSLSCSVSAVALYNSNIVIHLLLDCTITNEAILQATLSKSSLLNGQITAGQLLSATITVLPQLSAVISRPKCED